MDVSSIELEEIFLKYISFEEIRNYLNTLSEPKVIGNFIAYYSRKCSVIIHIFI